jgi:two-component system, OmpR family, KDP operon response regulator KdpE
VLLVEDHQPLVRALRQGLEEEGFAVDVATDGEEADVKCRSTSYDVVVLDIMLPKVDGLTLLKRWRGDGLNTHVLMLTARGAIADKVAGLDTGADDYLTKPFSMPELLARMRAAVRRSGSQTDRDTVVATRDFSIDLAAKRVLSRTGTQVHLTPTEWAILEILVRDRGALVSQRRLLSEIWGPAYRTETNYLRVYLAQLRRKLEPEPARPRYLITESGMGYRFQD